MKDVQRRMIDTNAPIKVMPPIRQLFEELIRLNPNYEGRVYPAPDEGRIVRIKFTPGNLRVLPSFKQLPDIKVLIIAENPVNDLSPLAGMPLEGLNCDRTLVSSLQPLRGMPLRSLHIQHTRVTDLSPLADMKLEGLRLTGTPVYDLSPIRSQPIKAMRLDLEFERHRSILLSLPDLQKINQRPAMEVLKPSPKKNLSARVRNGS